MGRIFVAGHRGLVGSAIVRVLGNSGVPGHRIVCRTHKELDLTDAGEVRKFFSMGDIEQVYLAAAKVGGVLANDTYPGSFIYENLMIQTNVIDSAASFGCKKLLFLGSNCIYPKYAAIESPITEERLMTGYLEPTNEPYAIAKIAGIKMCESYNREYKTDYRSVLPCNLYGMNDSYDELNGHITAGMIRRFHSAKVSGAKEVSVWGTGKPRREFLYGDDLAEACVIAMNVPLEEWQTQVPPRCNMVNIGSGTEHAIDEFAAMVARVVGYTGAITFDSTSPDGVFSKLSDSTKMRSFGWTPKTTLQEGLYRAYLDYRQRVIK